MIAGTAPVRATRYRDDINGIRALAVLLVIGYHALPRLVPGGFIGVDVFFVISGYLITGNIVRDIDAGAFSFLDFYARRCRRIIPALALLLGAVWLLGWFLLVAPEFRRLGRHVAAGATFTTNLMLWKEAGYFDPSAELKPLLHLWSLGVEEQFYLLWPPFLLLASRRRLRLWAVGAVLAASFALNVAMVGRDAVFVFYQLPTRLWELAIGAVLADVELRRETAPGPRGAAPVGHSRIAGAIAALASVAIVAAAFVIGRESVFPGWWAAVPTVATVALIAVGRGAWLSRTILSWRPLVIVGLISYPLYLWHWPLLSFARIIAEGEPAPAVRAALVAAAFLLAWLTWRFVEQPIQNRVFAFRGSRRLMRVCVATTVGALVVALAGGAVVWAASGFPSRPHGELPIDLTRLQKLDGVFPECSGPLAAGRALSWCLTASPGPPRLALFGDSHAYYLFPGFAGVYGAAHENVLLVGHTACAPLLDVRSFPVGGGDSCVDANRAAVELLSSAPSIRTVVLASLGPYYFSGVSVAADHRGDSDAARWRLEPVDGAAHLSKPALFEEGLSRTVSALEHAGKQVVFFLDVPELDFRPESCVDLRPLHLGFTRPGPSCGVPQARVLARQREYRRIAADLVARHPTLQVFDPLPYLCEGGWCEAREGDRLLYRDSNHLSAFGSTLVADRFRETMRLAADGDR